MGRISGCCFWKCWSIQSNEVVTHVFAPTQAQYIRLFVSEAASGSNGLYYVALAGLDFIQSANNDGQALLTWVATGDDDVSGTATSYEIRYSDAAITDGNWSAATLWLDTTPTPAPSGALETCTLFGLESGVTAYFGVKAIDEDGNSSPLSNVVFVEIP